MDPGPFHHLLLLFVLLWLLLRLNPVAAYWEYARAYAAQGKHNKIQSLATRGSVIETGAASTDGPTAE